MGKKSLIQVFCFEDEAGVVTSEMKMTEKEGVIIPIGAEVVYHSRNFIEEAEYSPQCGRLSGPCWSIEEFREDIPETIKLTLVEKESLAVDLVLKAMEEVFEWLEELYHNKFRKVQ